MSTRCVIVLTGLCLAAAVGLSGQGAESWDPGRPLATRVELGRLYSQLQWTADSSAYSDAMRALARRQALITKARLDSGDFNVGDRVQLLVDNEPTLRDTFPVTGGRVITLPDIGVVSLHGVLRSELEPYLTKALGKYLRQPAVHAHSFLQLSILGQVARPGFYNVPTEMPLSNAVSLAGGVGPESNLPGMYVERNGRRIWDAELLQQAISLGLTVDQLGLRGGDRVTVPKHSNALTESTVRTVSLILAIPLTIYSVSQIFHH
ncbi:MAG TPA: SLBB domain-containing protein [Gemmatimonadales bacterium]|nr:SLBB domain-containing protein [Gemmatimonadales bacterium]